MKYFFSFVLLSLLVSSVLAFDTSDCIQKNFVVTAYYSPETGQAFYYKPSYQDEKILNGEGLYGASGKKVFNGMLAGPASYSFGTLIYFPALGVGEIADRGGAIVQSGERGYASDRIDIWMGKGEEGLIRALVFGKKTLSGYVCTGMDVKKINVGLNWDFVPILKNFFDLSIWIQQLGFGRNDIWSWTLQKYLVKLGYLKEKHWNGVYDKNTLKALCNYQTKKGIFSKRNSDCGLFGKATRYEMKLDVQDKGLLPENLWETSDFDDIVKQAKEVVINSGNKSTFRSAPSPFLKEDKQAQAQIPVFQFYRSYTKNQKNGEIEILQKFLQSEKLFSGKVDGIYSQKVMNAVFDFQKKYQILTDESDAVLKGYLGPSTRKKMNEVRQ